MALPRRLVGYLGAGARAVADVAIAAGSSIIAIARDLRAHFSNLGISESRQLARYIQESTPVQALPPAIIPPAPIGGATVTCNESLGTNFRYIIEATSQKMEDSGEGPYRTVIDSLTELTEAGVGDRVLARVSSDQGSATRGVFIPADEIPADFLVEIIAIEYRVC